MAQSRCLHILSLPRIVAVETLRIVRANQPSRTESSCVGIETSDDRKRVGEDIHGVGWWHGLRTIRKSPLPDQVGKPKLIGPGVRYSHRIDAHTATSQPNRKDVRQSAVGSRETALQGKKTPYSSQVRRPLQQMGRIAFYISCGFMHTLSTFLIRCRPLRARDEHP